MAVAVPVAVPVRCAETRSADHRKGGGTKSCMFIFMCGEGEPLRVVVFHGAGGGGALTARTAQEQLCHFNMPPGIARTLIGLPVHGVGDLGRLLRIAPSVLILVHGARPVPSDLSGERQPSALGGRCGVQGGAVGGGGGG